MNWTPAQRQAVETRGARLLVSAGAGSGKTRVLVERFLRLLEENEGWQVADIVAVTFTEKAAREMTSRIRREIRSRIESSTSPDERRRWREHRNALDSARIGTIHALCAAILRAHPAEAGIDPTFEVLEEVAAATLLNQAIEEAIDQAVGDAGSPEIEVFTRLSTQEVRAILGSLIRQGERARLALARLSGLSADEILRFQHDGLQQLKGETLHALITSDAWQQAAATVQRLRADDQTDRREICRAQVAQHLDRLAELHSDSPDGVAAFINLLFEIEASVDLRGGSKKKWASEADFNAVKAALTELRSQIRTARVLRLTLNEADALAAEVSQQLIGLFGRVQRRFASLKAEVAGLDFNDLEAITDRLLASHPAVCARYTDPHTGLLRALMVDEFQDTSPLQKRILWALTPRSQEVFVIGDAKQSIYRFRGADVTVFQSARAEFDCTGGRIVGLDTCFRSHTRLIEFANLVFSTILSQQSRYDTPYEVMGARREPLHPHPTVEIHILTQNPEAETRLNTQALREAEAQLIAAHLHHLIEQAEMQVLDDDGHPRPIEYGDVALLFQASTNFETYEHALAEAGVPYVTIAGRGFYARQEITDLSHLLRFLASPIDELSLAAALRSPLFALSDETLLRLRLTGRPLWNALNDESLSVAEDEREALLFARKSLNTLRAISGRVRAAELITHVLIETGYLATLMALPHGERRVANVEKFVEQADALPTATLTDLVTRIEDLTFHEVREGEATIEEAGAVRLMTAHKSKGLEFPIVWIADATYMGARDRDRIATHADYGLGINVTRAADGLEEEQRPAFFEALRQLEEQMDAAEKRRLLYVAATRAKDHLLVSGSLGKTKLGGRHWLGHLAEALGIREDERESEGALAVARAVVHWHEVSR